MTARQLITDILRNNKNLDVEVEIGLLVRDEHDVGVSRETAPAAYIRSVIVMDNRILIMGEKSQVRTVNLNKQR